MGNLSGYKTLEKIYESSKTLVYRGQRVSDHQSVVIKQLKSEYPTPSELAAFRKQYTLTKDLNIPGIVRPYGLEPCDNGLALILEDFGAISLKDYYSIRALELSEFLSIALQIAEILAQLHQQRIIHKDLKPANLLINPRTGQVKITDFSIASITPKETQGLISPEGLEGTLPYMSPEQTGRMNRGIDYRTDFYSLGVTFYELLTQQLPFEAADPLEIVHCHLARQPIPIAQLNPTLPFPIAAIVMKLMAKMAENRYQSALGLHHDLEVCQRQLQQHGKIQGFILGQKDFCDHFQIPEKLYGREAEVEALLNTFENVADTELETSELTLISGYSGIGKSSLVKEVYKPIVQRRGYFISGKFDQLKRNVPYSAMIDALRSLVRQLLTENDTKLGQWREKVLQAVGTNGQVIVDVIPDLEQIIGKQSAIPVISPVEAQNRFNLVFQNFIRVFCQPQHPLVVFLDDLQWADSATLGLIKRMLGDRRLRHLFLIAAYRDNEVNATHPLMLLLDELQEQGVYLNRMILKPLSLDHITQLIADTLHTSTIGVKLLAQLIMQKTDGNPFFVNTFLKTLHQEKQLWFDFDKNHWQWNINEITALNITDNVVDLLLNRLKKLPEATQQVLRLAACIGNRFDLKTLSTIHAVPVSTIVENLTIAVQEGLIAQLATGVSDEIDLLKTRYKFLHDRVQQAAYALIDDQEKQPVHLEIGRLLLANRKIDAQNDFLFEIVGHLNLGSPLIQAIEQKLELATLNLKAGKKAKQSAAYTIAQTYLVTAINSLDELSWNDHELAFTLHQELAETEYLIGNFENAKQLLEINLAKAKSVIERAGVYRLLITLYTMQAKYQDAIAVSRNILALFGIELPETDLSSALTAEIALAKELLGNTTIAELLNQPEMTLAEKRAAAELLVNIGASTYCYDQNLWLVVVMKLVNLSLQYGQIPESTYGYSGYGLILGSMLGDYPTGYEFGQLSLKISEKFNDHAEKCKVCLVIGESLQHWVKPLKESAAIFTQGYQAGLESGELQFAGYNLGYQILSLFYQGLDLEALSDKILDYLKFAEQTQNQYLKDLLTASQLGIHHLQRNEMRSYASQEDITEIQFLDHWRQCSSFAVIGFYKILKAQILYLNDRAMDAIGAIQEAETLLKYLPGCISLAAFNFYHSLTLIALYSTANPEQQLHYWAQLSRNQQQMQHWAETCPQNFLHQYLLVKAEIARLSDDVMSAIDLYDQAIAAAQSHEFLQDTALANELAAKFWLAQGKKKLAQVYLTEAYYLYRSWGANAKLAQLESSYRKLLKIAHSPTVTTPVSVKERLASVTNMPSTSTDQSNLLDLATILKASQAIAQEIQLDRLLQTLLRVVLENVGAEQGTLLLPEGEQWKIAACSSNDCPETSPLQPLDIDIEEVMPISLIQYVIRIREPLIIDNVIEEPICAKDPYISKSQPKSILTFPILNQHKLLGIFYLENRQATQVFTHDRLKILTLLSTQIAISIENATLYQTLQTANDALRTSEARERERALELERSLHQLQQTQAQLIQTEKISSLGQLVAGVAHEVNNPINFIAGNLKHAERFVDDLIALVNQYRSTFSQPGEAIEETIEQIDLDFILRDLPELIRSMRLGTDRIKDIMLSLRTYSRVDGSEKQLVDLHKGLDSTLMILFHRLKATSDRPAIQIVKEYGDLPTVPCFSGQLNQVFMNLIANAVDALEESNQGKEYTEIERSPNRITIRTSMEGGSAIVSIRDNGSGMPPEVQTRLFEAFFTTKPEGKGTGLGLPICRQIVVEKHGGELRCTSEVGQGTEFTIRLPMAQPDPSYRVGVTRPSLTNA